MTKSKIVMLACLFCGLAVAVLGPFQAFGDRIKPGLGDLLNGTAAMVLLLLAGGIALVALKRV